LLDISFQVYYNLNLEEERREQSVEKRQAKLMAAIIEDIPNAQKTSSDKNARKLCCFKGKKLDTWQGIA
jgi:hypothetical protein